MRRSTLKYLACACAVALSMTASNTVFAQVDEDVPVTLTTSSVITLTAGNDMDFGEWFFFHDGTNNIAVVMNPFADTIVATPAGGTSSAVEITPSASIGSMLVQTPAAATVGMYGTITDFLSAALTLATPTYSLNGGAAVALSTNAGAPTTFTATGGSDDTIEFGATVTVSAQPADNAHTANLNVEFDY